MIFTKSLFFFFFCSSPEAALGCSFNRVCVCAVCSYACVWALRLLCWSFSVPVHQLPRSSKLSLPENSVPDSLWVVFSFYMQECDVSSFVIKTLKIWERVERKVAGFTAEWSWLSSISEPVGRQPHHPFVTAAVSQIPLQTLSSQLQIASTTYW